MNICAHHNLNEAIAYTTIQGQSHITPFENQINWHIVNFTDDTSRYKTILSFFRAFRLLEPHFGGILLEPISTSDLAHIKIHFANNSGYPITPPIPFQEGVLAYAIASRGEIYFNDEYRWDEMHNQDTDTWNLVKIAVHELLHLFFVGHTDRADDIMFWQAENDDIINITSDSIAAIRYLYGQYFQKQTPALMQSVDNIYRYHTARGLRHFCKQHDLSTKGSKRVLAIRVFEFFKL